MIVTGDFNVAHRPIDLARPKENYNKIAGYTQVEIDGMDRFINNGFIDSFRHFYPDKVQYSFWSARFGLRAKKYLMDDRLLLVDQQFGKNVIKDAFILTDEMGSDHCPIGLIL